MMGFISPRSHLKKPRHALNNPGAAFVKGPLPLLALVIILAFSETKSQSQDPARHPSVLEAFLTRTRNASLQKKEVGVLTASNKAKATFTAIIAGDPANPAVKIKGIEVRMEDGDCEATVYVDDDKEEPPRGSLAEFQDLLTQLIRRKEEITKRCREGDEKACNEPGITSPGYVTTGALNRSAPSQGEYYPRYTIFNAGWYGGAKGVILGCTCSDTNFYFPGTNLEVVVHAIAAGQAFLDAN